MTLVNGTTTRDTANCMSHTTARDVGTTLGEYRFPPPTGPFQRTDPPLDGTRPDVPPSGKRRSGPTLHKKKRSYDLRDDFQNAAFAVGHRRNSSAASETMVGPSDTHPPKEPSPPLVLNGKQLQPSAFASHSLANPGQENVQRARL